MTSAFRAASQALSEIASASDASDASNIPPVSVRMKLFPSTSPREKTTSRVIPGSVWTRDTFLPTNRLKSVDFPTLGKPRMTTWGRLFMGPGPSAGVQGILRRERLVQVDMTSQRFFLASLDKDEDPLDRFEIEGQRVDNGVNRAQLGG
jgi:hypothetical protein